MPQKRRRTPQEKKRLSLAKDRRNNYGQNDKASRRLIPLYKKLSNRSARRVSVQLLIDEPETSENALRRRLKRRWRKSNDERLGNWISKQMNARYARIGGKTRRRIASKARDQK